MRAAITLAVRIAVSGWGAETTPVLDLNYRDDRLTVRIQHVPADRVAAALGKATGADVQGGFDGEVTVAWRRRVDAINEGPDQEIDLYRIAGVRGMP